MDKENIRIAKNTGLLYVRQLLTLALSLYTARITLQVLGETDYGVFATVAGFTALLSTVTSSFASGTQRFITFELGCGNYGRLKKVYCSSVLIHIFLSVSLIIFGEVIGSWFIFNKMTIPLDRVMTAFWVFQFTLINAVLALMNAPNYAEIIAHEDMGIWAFISIVESVLKCISVITLFFISWDKLLIYSLYLFVIQFLVRMFCLAWCKKKYLEAKFYFVWDKDLIISMLSVTGWMGLSNIAATGFIQGVNLLLNVFFGPIINAAYSVSMQAYSGIRQFCSSFQLASNPQIIKYYSIGEMKKMHNLLSSVCKLSFYLIFVLALPFMINVEFVLDIWLKDVPDHTASFFVLLLIYAFTDVFAYPLDIAAQATGRLKKYSLLISSIVLSSLVIAYIAFAIGAIPEFIIIIAIVLSWIGLFIRLLLLCSMINLDFHQFINDILAKILCVGCISAVIPLLIVLFLPDILLTHILSFIVSPLCTLFIIYIIGLTETEKEIIKSFFRKIINRSIVRRI